MDGEVSIQQSPVMQDKAMRITKTIVSSVSTLFGLAAVLALSIAVIMWARVNHRENKHLFYI